MKMDTTWVEVFNTIAAPRLTGDLDRDRFRFKGFHRNHAIFELVLIHRDYDVDFFEEVRKYVNAYREEVCQLATIKTAKISIKRRHGDYYYKCNQYHVWYYFIHFEEAAERPRTDVRPEIADLDRYWMLKGGKYHVFQNSQLHIKGFDEGLGILELEGSFSEHRLERAKGWEELAYQTYGQIVHCLRDYLDVQYIEYFMKLNNGDTEYYFAGPAGERLILLKEYEV